MHVCETIMDGACGVSILCDFCEPGDWYKSNISTLIPGGGCGLVTAGFIKDDPICDKVFAACVARGKLLWKSRTRKNRNSGNLFYMAVFDWSDKGKARYGFDDQDWAE